MKQKNKTKQSEKQETKHRGEEKEVKGSPKKIASKATDLVWSKKVKA